MSALKAPSPTGPVPPPTAVHVGSAMRVRAIGGATQRTFDPAQMTRDELVRFTLALMDETTALREFAAKEQAAHEDLRQKEREEFEERLKRATDKALQAKRETDRWKTNYSFTLTLIRDTFDRLVKGHAEGRVRSSALNALADEITETCLHYDAGGTGGTGGGVSYWLQKAEILWNALDGRKRQDAMMEDGVA